jgi:hypothetical protein
VRLRILSEAECYARCYGEKRDDAISLVRVVATPDQPERPTAERLRTLYEEEIVPRAEAA